MRLLSRNLYISQVGLLGLFMKLRKNDSRISLEMMKDVFASMTGFYLRQKTERGGD